MAGLQGLALHQGFGEGIGDGQLRQAHDEKRQGDQTEILGAEKPAEHDEDGRGDQVPAPAFGCRPEGTADGLFLQALSRIAPLPRVR